LKVGKFREVLQALGGLLTLRLSKRDSNPDFSDGSPAMQ